MVHLARYGLRLSMGWCAVLEGATGSWTPARFSLVLWPARGSGEPVGVLRAEPGVGNVKEPVEATIFGVTGILQWKCKN
jgi:hypothetical protein